MNKSSKMHNVYPQHWEEVSSVILLTSFRTQLMLLSLVLLHFYVLPTSTHTFHSTPCRSTVKSQRYHRSKITMGGLSLSVQWSSGCRTFEPDYLQPLRNSATDMIQHSVPDIINWLIATYGTISESEILTNKHNLAGLKYDTTQPVDFFSTPSTNFVTLVT